MRQFDFYEFTGILVPGAAALAGVLMLVPGLMPVSAVKDFSIGGFGLLVVLAYVAGHLVQAVGNLAEWLWWKAWGGMPTDWVRKNPTCLLAESQAAVLPKAIAEQLKLPDVDLRATSREQWYSITRQISAAVDAAGRGSRIQTLNGNYGLNRGLVAALAVVLVMALIATPADWAVVGGLGVAIGLALARMHRFGKHQARELFVQFLQLPTREQPSEKKV
ncbi:MAG: hypothetical protein HT579_18180 [Candidatus Accumulibacter similis]|nr:MAG: hypothetical protein HT579_18180 [Candidatus Accumulibacter similis]